MERPAVKATYAVSAEAPPRATELRAACQGQGGDAAR
jgi:hypothetical protein